MECVYGNSDRLLTCRSFSLPIMFLLADVSSYEMQASGKSSNRATRGVNMDVWTKQPNELFLPQVK